MTGNRRKGTVVRVEFVVQVGRAKTSVGTYKYERHQTVGRTPGKKGRGGQKEVNQTGMSTKSGDTFVVKRVYTRD